MINKPGPVLYLGQKTASFKLSYAKNSWVVLIYHNPIFGLLTAFFEFVSTKSYESDQCPTAFYHNSSPKAMFSIGFRDYQVESVVITIASGAHSRYISYASGQSLTIRRPPKLSLGNLVTEEVTRDLYALGS